MLKKLKEWAKLLKRQLFILYVSYKDSRVKWYTKLIVACVVAYAFSPLDLIPDFIPILGLLDDIIIIPIGITLSLKLLPQEVISDAKIKAEALSLKARPKNWITAGLIILIWIVTGFWINYQLFN